MDTLDQPGHSGRRHQRGCAATEKHAVEPAPSRGPGVVIELRQQGGSPALLIYALAHMAVEIAIGAFRTAERPVDVDAKPAIVSRCDHWLTLPLHPLGVERVGVRRGVVAR